MERQALKCFTAPAAKAARAVRDSQPCDDADVPVGECAQQHASPGPILDASTGHVARADDEVRVRAGREQTRNVGRVVRQIGIHLTDVCRVGTERVLQARDVRQAKPPWSRPMQYGDAPTAFTYKYIGHVTRAVRRPVIHDEHPDVRNAQKGGSHHGEDCRARCRWERSPAAASIAYLWTVHLGLLYGWPLTRAPAARTASVVASLDPSSMTSTSCQGATARRRDTTAPIAPSSFVAGITTVTDDGSANELLHDAVPADLRGPRQPVLSELPREIGTGGEARNRLADGGRLRCADIPVFAVANKFQRAARIGRGHHRFGA